MKKWVVSILIIIIACLSYLVYDLVTGKGMIANDVEDTYGVGLARSRSLAGSMIDVNVDERFQELKIKVYTLQDGVWEAEEKGGILSDGGYKMDKNWKMFLGITNDKVELTVQEKGVSYTLGLDEIDMQDSQISLDMIPSLKNIKWGEEMPLAIVGWSDTEENTLQIPEISLDDFESIESLSSFHTVKYITLQFIEKKQS